MPDVIRESDILSKGYVEFHDEEPFFWFVFPLSKFKTHQFFLKYNIGDKAQAPTKAPCCQESHEPAWHGPQLL